MNCGRGEMAAEGGAERTAHTPWLDVATGSKQAVVAISGGKPGSAPGKAASNQLEIG
jgi:hypothetical protein